jgi:glycosyltransferase involved in cell wall biosynthesis
LADTSADDLQRAREELARLADVERELVFWRARAEKAEALADQWRTVKNRSLWKIFASVDQLRARIAPPDTRRERLVLGSARRAARALAPLARPPRSAATQFRPSGHKDVLFVYDESGAWTSYRCDHQAEGLTYIGMSADVVRSTDIDLVAAVDHYDTFVLNRVRWSEDVARFVAAARSAEKGVLFDTDDLIFERDLYLTFAAFLQGASDRVHKTWSDRIDGYRKTLEACDRATVSTDPLAAYAQRRVSRVDVVYNAVSAQLVNAADEAIADRSYAEQVAEGRKVTIGYLSGSASHNRDFLEAADAVLAVLEDYPHVNFLIIGFLELPPHFDRFRSRITKIPKQPFHALMKLTARVDINLAPLERDNPFNECKSCVKYLEAGLVGVPTLASARPDFVRVIDNGRNGMLADQRSEWHDALRQLVESRELRLSIGRLAAEDVRANHTTKARAPLLRRALVRHPAEEMLGVR